MTCELALDNDQFRFGLIVQEYRFFPSMLWNEKSRTGTWYPGTKLDSILRSSPYGQKQRADLAAKEQ